MKSDLGISISVSAVIGGALSGLTNIGKAMDTLKSTTKTLSERQKELGKVLERNKDRLGVSSAKQLWQEYDKIGLAVSKPRGVDVVAAQIQHQPRGKARVLLAVGFIDRFARQCLAVGIGIDQQPFDMGGLQGFAATGFIIGDGLRQDFGQIVRNHFDVLAF